MRTAWALARLPGTNRSDFRWSPFSPLAICLSLLLLCSCATTPNTHPTSPASKLPVDLKMNQDAGSARLLIVPVRLDDGGELPFILDTGASGTCLDKSLEPRLGKRLDTLTAWHFGVKLDAGEYAAPKLYCGGSLLLMTGTNIATFDLTNVFGSYRVMGVLGMDVLEHYCIQLDFSANRIRFLDDANLNMSACGKPFPLTDDGSGCFCISQNLVGSKGPGSLIDTGCDTDGWLTGALFRQWTNQTSLPPDGQVRSPTIGRLGADSYPDIDLWALDDKQQASDDSHMKQNGVGLRFLSRHLVTLDFPKRTMYLKRTSDGPLRVRYTRDMMAVGKSGCRFIWRLKKAGRLPGWSKTDKFASNRATFRYEYDSLDPAGTLDLLKQGNPSVYHYTFSRFSSASPWKLQKAWRTDQNGQLLEEYTIP